MRRLSLAAILVLNACLLMAAPARADEPPAPEPAVSLPEAPEEETTVGAVVAPIPLIAIYGLGGVQNLRLGPTRHTLSARGGYVWSFNTAFDPDTTRPETLLSGDDYWQPANFWNLFAAWGWHVAPAWTLYLDGYAAGGGLTRTPGYDQALTEGLSASWGPLLEYSTLDEAEFPTAGFMAQAGWAPGYHWGAEELGFQRASLELKQFYPLGPDRTFALRGLAQAGWPKLAWIDKFYAGGAQYLRGYQWSRFTGDRLLTGTAEFRWLFLPNFLPADWGVAGGLAWEVYLDAGRAWEATRGVPVLSDLRYGGGTGLMLTLDRMPVGRLELNASPEGFYPVAGLGASF